jgi:GxxExxY protein
MHERDPQTGQILGCAVEVFRTLGHGFLEAVYQHALAQELMANGVSFAAQVPMPVFYKGTKLDYGYRADFICHGSVLVELKAQAGLTEVDDAQVINYLRASELERALLLNFGAPKLQIKRLVLSAHHRREPSFSTESQT